MELFIDEFHEDDTERLVREARRFIKEHVYESIGLKEVAEALHISAGYLSGTFSKYEPGGLANYINQIKIAEAQKLLKKDIPKQPLPDYMLYPDLQNPLLFYLSQ